MPPAPHTSPPGGVPQTIEDLHQHERLSFGPSPTEPHPWVLTYVGKGKGPSAPVHHKPRGSLFIAGQMDALIHAGVAGLGIFPMDIGSGIRYWEAGLLKIVLPDYEMRAGAELSLLYPHRGLLPVRTRAFIEFVTRVAKAKLRPPNFDPHDYAADPGESSGKRPDLLEAL